MFPALRLSVVVALGLLMTAAPALARDSAANCTVRMIHASHDGEGIDPRITTLRPYLEKEPFTAWKKFTLIEEKQLAVAPAVAGTFTLPNGKHASLTYMDHVYTGNHKHRLRLRFEITDGEKKVLDTTFVLDEGGMVLQAGQKHENGLLILAFGCEITHS